MGKFNVDVGVSQYRKLTDGIYTQGLSGYKVVVTSAPSRHRGDIMLFYRYSFTFTVKAICQFSANVIAFKL